MSTLGAVNSQHSVRFNTMVCDVQFGGYFGRIRGYPNRGKDVVFIGPTEMFNCIKLSQDFSRDGVGHSNLIAFRYSCQCGSTIHRIKSTIQVIKELT